MAFNVAEWLAEALDVGDDEVERTSGPTPTFSEIEAEYAVNSKTVETVETVVRSSSHGRAPRSTGIHAAS